MIASLGQRLEELRKKKGLGQEQLSIELGFSKNAIEKYERGRQIPSKQQLEKIAAYFGVKADYFTGEADETNTMAMWMADVPSVPQKDVSPAPARKLKKDPEKEKKEEGGEMLYTAFLKNDLFKQAVLDVLKTPEGKELIKKALGK